MKKNFSLLLFITFILSSTAFSQRDEEFLKNKLYIVQTESPAFDSALKSTLEQHWDVTEIGGYITRKELIKFKKSREHSFLVPAIYSWTNGSIVKFRSGLFFFRGKKMEQQYAFPAGMAYFGGYAGDNLDGSIYRLELMIRSVNNTFKYRNSMDSVREIFKPSLLKKKTLLVNSMHNKKGGLFYNFTEGAFKGYPYKIEFANTDRIAEIIKDKDEKYVFAVPIVNDDTRLVHLYDINTGFLLGGFKRKGLAALPVREKDVEELIELINE